MTKQSVNTEIEYFIEGSGDVVVLIPGFGVDVTYFEHLSSCLAGGGFTAVAVNPRGVGGSSGSTRGLTLYMLAADVAAVIEPLDCGPVYLLGHGYGNRVTRCLATYRPDLVRSLILLAAPGSAKAADPDVNAALADWARDDASESECIKVMEYMVGDPATAANIWRQLRRYPALARAQLAALQTPAIDYYEGGGTAPLVVVQGSPIDPRHLRMLGNCATGSRTRSMEMPGVGHMPFLERPEEVADAVLSYLR